MHSVMVLFGAIVAAFAGVSFLPGLAGWLLLALSAAGVVHVLAISIIEARGVAPTYECFLFPLFFFCLALGFGAGAITGFGASTPMRIVCACAGLALGYWIGLLVGLYGQRIGFFAILLYPVSAMELRTPGYEAGFGRPVYGAAVHRRGCGKYPVNAMELRTPGYEAGCGRPVYRAAIHRRGLAASTRSRSPEPPVYCSLPSCC